MGMRVFLASALMLLSSAAFAEHAVTPDTGAAPITPPGPATAPAVVPAPQPAPQVQAMLPSELDVYLVPAATHEVCTTGAWGYGEVRTDCRAEPLPPRRGNPALRGICTTRYGLRTCY
jgi:hypothetical protein